MKSKAFRKGFTLIEIMITVIVAGVIAALALPKFSKIVESARCKNAQNNLITIHSAAKIYRIKNRTFAIPSGINTAAINTNLRLAIVDPYFQYTFTGSQNEFYIRAERIGSAYFCHMSNYLPVVGNPACTDGDICNTPENDVPTWTEP